MGFYCIYQNNIEMKLPKNKQFWQTEFRSKSFPLYLANFALFENFLHKERVDSPFSTHAP